MNNSRTVSSLRRVTGYSQKQIAGIKVNHPMQLADPQVKSNRRVVIQKDRLDLSHDVERSFEIMVNYIAKVIRTNREEVENALIATGSPKGVRHASLGNLNAMVQNRLTQKDRNGDAFRQYMSALVTAMYGKKLQSDKFFRIQEDFANSTGQSELSSSTENILSLPTLPATTIDVSETESTILPYQRSGDDGVEQNKSEQDWGSILSGGAQVITAVGGVIGLFTGGQQTQAGGSAFDQYNGGDGYGGDGYGGDNNDKSGGNKWIIWLVVLAVLGVLGFVLYKQFKKK